MKVKEKRKYSSILSTLSGILIVASSSLIISNPRILGVSKIQILPTLILVTISLIFGCLVLFGSFLTYNNSKSGPIVVLIFSFLTLVIGGVLFTGFVFGFILGIIGAILGFSIGSSEE